MAVGEVNRLGSNLTALRSLNALSDVNRRLAASQLRLATGKRINEAADDPSGYSVANALSRTSRGAGVALRGLKTFENLLSVAEGGLTNINEILFNIRDLVVQGGSDTLGTTERTAINAQLDSLRSEIDRIAAETSFNGTPLLDGTFGSGGGGPGPPTPPVGPGPGPGPSGPPSSDTDLRFQTGAGGDDYINFGIDTNFSSESLGIGNVAVDTANLASNSLGNVDDAIASVTWQVQDIGSAVQRVRLIEDNLGIAITNTTAARSRIVDSDIAQEQAAAARLTIIQKLATAQLAHANLAPAAVLQLFRHQSHS